MGVLEAIIGIIQGLTEFLPVSSSGHIELSKAILNVEVEGDENVMFTVVLHVQQLKQLQFFEKTFCKSFRDYSNLNGMMILSLPSKFSFPCFRSICRNCV